MNKKNEEIEGEEPVDDFNHEEAPDDTDWKAKALEFQGRAKRLETKNAKLNEKLKSPEKKGEDAPPQNKQSPSNELTDGQIAILHANQIKGAAEVALMKEYMSNTGKTLLDVLDNKYFQNDLKDMRDAKIVADATPQGGRRGGSQADNSVDYHLAKYLASGKMPEDADMREKVLDARLAKEANKSMFSDNPIIG